VSRTKPSNPKDRAATTKLDLSLFPDTAVAYGALALTEGDLKYGGFNWREAGVSANVYVAAAKRHLAKWYNGSDVDPKTKVPHLAYALACIAIIIDAEEQGRLNDDRPPKSPEAERIFEAAERVVEHLQSEFPNPPERYKEKATEVEMCTLIGIPKKDCISCQAEESYEEKAKEVGR
jgi:hypothetical protein